MGKGMVMRHRYICWTMLVLGWGLGCQQADKSVLPSSGASTAVTSGTIAGLAGQRYVLEAMVIGGQTYELADTRPTLLVSNEGKVSGLASLNRYMGRLRIDSEGVVSWAGPLAMTRMAGPAELMRQEQAFVEALTKTTRLSVEGEQLYAESEDGQMRLVFKR